MIEKFLLLIVHIFFLITDKLIQPLAVHRFITLRSGKSVLPLFLRSAAAFFNYCQNDGRFVVPVNVQSTHWGVDAVYPTIPCPGLLIVVTGISGSTAPLL